jgi:hypothetical protein
VTDPFDPADLPPGCLDDDLATELALGTVDGRERARALGHLAGCARCRSRVDALREVGESLLLLAPPAEPPAGFEQAVLARLRSTAAPGVGRRRVLLAAAALLVLVAAVGAGVAVSRRSEPTPSPALTAAAMHTAAGIEVGTVWRHTGDPSWVFVSVPGWRRWESGGGPPRDYQLELTLQDGRRIRIEDAPLRPADGTWATTIAVDARSLAAVSVVDTSGRVWCTGTFPTTT